MHACSSGSGGRRLTPEPSQHQPPGNPRERGASAQGTPRQGARARTQAAQGQAAAPPNERPDPARATPDPARARPDPARASPEPAPAAGGERRQASQALGVPLAARGGVGRRRLLSGRGARRSRLLARMTAAAAGVRSMDEDTAGIDGGCRPRSPGSINAVGSRGSAQGDGRGGGRRSPRPARMMTGLLARLPHRCSQVDSLRRVGGFASAAREAGGRF